MARPQVQPPFTIHAPLPLPIHLQLHGRASVVAADQQRLALARGLGESHASGGLLSELRVVLVVAELVILCLPCLHPILKPLVWKVVAVPLQPLPDQVPMLRRTLQRFDRLQRMCAAPNEHVPLSPSATPLSQQKPQKPYSQPSTTPHNPPQPPTTLHNPPQPATTPHNPQQPPTTLHNPPQHSTTLHNPTTPHNPPQPFTTLSTPLHNPLYNPSQPSPHPSTTLCTTLHNPLHTPPQPSVQPFTTLSTPLNNPLYNPSQPSPHPSITLCTTLHNPLHIPQQPSVQPFTTLSTSLHIPPRPSTTLHTCLPLSHPRKGSTSILSHPQPPTRLSDTPQPSTALYNPLQPSTLALCGPVRPSTTVCNHLQPSTAPLPRSTDISITLNHPLRPSTTVHRLSPSPVHLVSPCTPPLCSTRRCVAPNTLSSMLKLGDSASQAPTDHPNHEV